MPAQSSPSVTRRQVLAFRLHGHHLNERQPGEALLQVAGACGLQNTASGGALLSLHARLRNLNPGDLDRALQGDKRLLQTWSLRAASHVFPSADAPVFTRALLPSDEEALRFFIYGVIPALEKIGITAIQAVDLGVAALEDVLTGRALTKDDIGRLMAAAVLPHLSPDQASAWQSSSPYASGQSLGESVARFTAYIHALQGLICHAGRQAGHMTYRLTTEWLASPIPVATPRDCSALVRRYLRCYGPSTVEHFAAWAGISPLQAASLWNPVREEFSPVLFGSQETSILTADLPRLLAAQPPTGVRFLPPYDPYLNQRDRATLLPESRLHRRLWRTSANPGAVLVDGELAALWRPAKTGSRLNLSIEPFTSLSANDQTRILSEAETLAPYRGARSVEIRYLSE